MVSDKKKIAVILNKNARRFSRSLYRDIKAIIPNDHVWATSTLDEAKAAVREILAGDFDMIFTGGGDGTIVTTITTIRDVVLSERPRKILPVGVLKLGTGNAWAYAVGVKNGLSQLSHVAGGGHFSLVPFSLIQVGEVLCPFVGVGWDAHILNDYYELNRRYEGSIFSPVMKNLFGYLFASATRTVPRFMKGRDFPEVEVSFTGKRLYGLDRNGDHFPLTDQDGAVIYRGPVSLVAGSTIPFFGYAFRAFPYAGRMPGTMHLRIARLDVGETVRNLRGLWKGTYLSDGIVDFLADGVRLTFAKDEPIEVGGDPMGYTREVDLVVPDFTVNIVTF